MNKDGSKIFVIIAFFIVAIILVVVMIVMIQNANKPEPIPEINQTELELNETQREYNKLLFDYKMVRKTNDYYNSNYLISPLSLGYALKILEEGSAGNTSTQLQNLIGNYEVPDAVNIDNTISIANALFILTSYKGKINSSYINNVESKYSANVLYDAFTNADGINNWVNGKTFGMIPKALYSINRNTKMMIVNTIALDIAWKQKMDSANTHSAKFTKIDRTQIDVAMMTDKNAFGYLENENARGIVKHYAVYDPTTGTTATQDSTNKIELEYIAIIPKTNINDYISKLDQYELSRLIQTVQVHSSTKDLVMNIPKYSYEFSHEYIKQILLDSNVTDAFDENADFSGIMSGLFVDDIIHKTFIEFGEEGTKAAAVSIAKIKDNSVPSEKENIQIDFNSPFLYLIKEKNSTNLWFFGVVYEPMSWEEYDKLIEAAKREAERKKRGY
jgi:serpin B